MVTREESTLRAAALVWSHCMMARWSRRFWLPSRPCVRVSRSVQRCDVQMSCCRGRCGAANRQENGAKCTKPVVARDDGDTLRYCEICSVVKKERAAALFEAAPVEKNHGGKGAGAGGGRGEHVEVQTVFRLQFGDIRIVMVLQATGAVSARELQN